MQHYKRISKWKTKTTQKCRFCRKVVDTNVDYFVLRAHWKIKKKPDEHCFCSLKCLKNWTKED